MCSLSYWYSRAKISEQHLAINEIKRKISRQDFQLEIGIDDERAWIESPQAIALMEEMKSRELDQKIFTAQAKQLEMESDKPDKSMRRSFMKFFTTSSLGLNIKDTGAGDRPSSDQSNFRASLLEVSKQRLRPGSESIWCPISGSHYHASSINAAHIFAWTHGQDTMTAIFGDQTPPELFSPYNGLLISIPAEKRLEKGHIIIVPRLSDEPSDTEIQEWHRSTTKEYQIRVLEPNGEGMKNEVFGREDGRTWAEMDKQPVVFRSDFRPGARYLYFLYCVTMLRRSWRLDNRRSALSDEPGKPCWGTKGSFMKKGMLLAFVEEMGRQYEGLLQGVIEESDTAVEPDESALFAANKQIISSVQEVEESEDSDDEEEEDEANVSGGPL